ncbi:hypothetical protein HJFPF1_05227 [Paramyrothecium foliicola]|nr:hypothetical protein HJFPF1_05227 [Paramyrothecium foliicola]
MSVVKSLAYAGLASMASAHILMTNPVPYTPIGVTNGPLAADGSDFPCKTGGSYTGVNANVYEAGSTQKLEFKGTAVHGGGSCQVSVTTDLNPTKDSVWKVIKSIEGGCPAKDTPLNLPGDSAEAPVPFSYDFTVPDIAAGTYTLAWTWFNKIGNREMYMNCAPLEVTGGTGSTSLDSLPDILVANVGNGCSTTEGTDIQFPNPGSDVVQLNGATAVFGPPQGTCTGSAGTGGGAAPPPPPPSEPTEAPTVENPTVEQPPVQQPPVEQPVAPVAPPPVQAPSGGACTEGNWKCIDGSSFSRCAAGAWSATMAVAPGTTCVVGEGATLNLA